MLALVIDDSRVTRMILRKSLVSMGFHVLEASNGQEGLDALAGRADVTLMLVDWNMPVMDGIAFLRAVRDDARWDGVPVVMVTSEAELIQITTALEAGADEYLMKPFTEDALRDKLVGLRVLAATVA